MTLTQISLLPNPRTIHNLEGVFSLSSGKVILVDAESATELLPALRKLQRKLQERAVVWSINTSQFIPGVQIALEICVLPGLYKEPQRYQLSITPQKVKISAAECAGAFYALTTFSQLLDQFNDEIPCLAMDDWPDFPVRGVMLDVSRDKVPTMETLSRLVELLSSIKINQLQLYTEHTFAYLNHPVVWEKASPISGQEVLELDALCKDHFIELVPNQNSFGHMHRWLEHPEYAALGEVLGQFTAPWGQVMSPFSLCPEDPASLELIDSLYDELLPHFSSRMVNVGCDETFDLGQGRSKTACEQRGTGRVYLDYLIKIYRSLRRRGFRMQFWGDIILQSPELVKELPADLIALDWGYEADHPFESQGAQFAQAGVPFYVCPGTSAWGSIGGRTDNALGNLLNAAENGLKHGACGYLITDWGDGGHWQVLPVSYLGFAAGAAYSWCVPANRGADIAGLTSRFMFQDATGGSGKLAFEMGNIYRAAGIEPANGSVLFWVMQLPLLELSQSYGSEAREIGGKYEQMVEQVRPLLEQVQSQADDARQVKLEFEQTARILSHAAKRLDLVAEKDSTVRTALQKALKADLESIIGAYRQNWLARNRVGGLAESVKRLADRLVDYD